MIHTVENKEIYHFTNSKDIAEFRHVKPKREYSQASGYGVYFTPMWDKGMVKYGCHAKYCYRCTFSGVILNLGEYDSMFFDQSGTLAHSCSFVTKNFKLRLENSPQLREPDLILGTISSKAYKWLVNNNIQAVHGMEYWGYACSEFAVIGTKCVKILEIIKLSNS